MSAAQPWPFGALRPLSYRMILADPPWQFENWSKAGEWKNASRHYRCMPTAEIAALPVGHLAAGDCALILWATAPLLDAAFLVMRSWGFTYKTMGAWAKRSRRDGGWQMAPGYILRGAVEPFLVGTIGDTARRQTRAARSVRNLIVAPVREHSRKPEAIYELAETVFPGPYLDLFSRQRRDGWDIWGNEVDLFPQAEAVPA